LPRFDQDNAAGAFPHLQFGARINIVPGRAGAGRQAKKISDIRNFDTARLLG
jgi:hypothetical protein